MKPTQKKIRIGDKLVLCRMLRPDETIKKGDWLEDIREYADGWIAAIASEYTDDQRNPSPVYRPIPRAKKDKVKAKETWAWGYVATGDNIVFATRRTESELIALGCPKETIIRVKITPVERRKK